MPHRSVKNWRRFAFTRPHLFVVEGLGGTPARLSVERAAREWGWPLAAAPADADLVVACGAVPDGPLARVVAQTPLPRRLVRPAGEATLVREHLLGAREALLDEPVDEPDLPRDQDEDDWPVLATTAAPAGDHSARGHGNHGGHGGHGDNGDHGDHGEMEMPGGLMMAERAPDRDGLTLDVLHMSLGPLLPWWPGGLRLDLAVQGDVVQEATVRVPPDAYGAASFWDDPWRRASRGEPVTQSEADTRRAAARLDSATRLLRLAGHDGGASTAARLRDTLVTGAMTDAPVAVLSRRIRRDFLLKAMLRGVATAASEDAWGRLLSWFDDAEDAVAAARKQAAAPLDPAEAPPRAGDRAACLALPELVTGQELATVRLIVAGLDPDMNTVLVERPAA